jgi:aminopeptidase N
MNSKEVQRIDDVKSLRERQFVEDASPTSHPIQPKSYISMNNFYTATVYEKGAEVIRMIHTLLGEEKFRKAMDLYFETFDGQAVRTDDFLWAMATAGEIDLSQFELWYHQSGTPKLQVSESFEHGMYTLKCRQIIPHAMDASEQKPYYYPLKIALFDAEGKEVLEKVLILSKEEEIFNFEGFSEQPVVSLNRDFSAPIIIEQAKPNFAFLMRHDTNSFVRYESAQSFAVATLEAMMQNKPIDRLYVEAFGSLLRTDVDLAYKALLLEFPTIATLMQRQEVVDFEPLYEAKERLQKHLATTYKEELLALYKANNFPKNSEIDSLSMGQRALKNGCLRLLSALESQDVIALAKVQYEESLSMSDRIVALDILENTSAEFSQIALADFYARYKEDTLVMNKYFSILAASEREGTLDRVMALQNDGAYDKKVPNLVRSLIGVFARNYKHFHAKDGYGYAFVADKIIEIDVINAQMASGLAGAFKIYKKMNSVNKLLMQKELKRILEQKNLSKNCYEIVSKILQAS